MSKKTLEWMRGRGVSDVRRGDAGEWVFEFGSACVLQSSTLWRILKAGRVDVTKRDDGQQFGLPALVSAAAEALKAFDSKTVTDAMVDDDVGDLVIQFAQDVRLEVFNDSAGFEAWDLVGPNGARVVACGSNGAAIWSPAV